MQHVAKKAVTTSRASSPARHRWSPSSRLLRRADFDAVYKLGRRRVLEPFAIYFRHTGSAHSRFGMSVRKALGGAVVRNRIRRRIREILRLHLEEIPQGWDIVIHPRTSVAAASFPALEQALLRLIQSAIARPSPQA